MDVTFHESQSYFVDPPLSLQGERPCEDITVAPATVLPVMIEVEEREPEGVEGPKERVES